MNIFVLYALAAVALFALGLYGFLFRLEVVRKLIALNVMGSSTFLLLVAVAFRNRDPGPDPVPHAMVLTGIVVAVSTTALGLAIARRIRAETGVHVLPEDEDRR